MTEDDVDRAEPVSAKAVAALLREARSLSRRADKLGGGVAAMVDPKTHQLAAEACTGVFHPARISRRAELRGTQGAVVFGFVGCGGG